MSMMVETLTSLLIAVAAGVITNRICKWRREINIKSLFPVLSLRNKSKPLNRSLLRASPGRAGQEKEEKEVTTSPIKNHQAPPGGFLPRWHVNIHMTVSRGKRICLTLILAHFPTYCKDFSRAALYSALCGGNASRLQIGTPFLWKRRSYSVAMLSAGRSA